MKYIKKVNTPAFFLSDTTGLTKWGDYYGSKKRRLKQFILEKEQHHLCCYCEKKTKVANSHLEHIHPKSADELKWTFDYQNILVSCEGNHFNEINDNGKNTCGHKKDADFVARKFLNPTLVKDLFTHFVFDADNGQILASTKEREKALYTIELLNLNGVNDKLAEARIISKKAFLNYIQKKPPERQRQILTSLLSSEATEFASFFRYLYRRQNT